MSPEEYPDNTAEAKEKAEQSGRFDVIVADDYTLTLDLDSESDAQYYERGKRRLKDLGIVELSSQEWKSKSGNRHVLIRIVGPVPIYQRIAMEMALGSDRLRGFLALRDVDKEYEFPLMLFRPKKPDAAVEVGPVDFLVESDCPF